MGAESELLRRLQEALGRTEVDVDDMVEEAWRSAEAEVRAVLQRAFQHELLDRVVRTLEEQPSGHRPSGLSSVTQPSSTTPAKRVVTDAERPGSVDTGEDRTVRPPASDATYLFGITRAEVTLDPDLPTVGGGQVRGISEGELQAVVCDADPHVLRSIAERGPDDLDLLAEAAHAHEEVLAHVAAQASVLPLRLGTLLHDDRAVAALLEANRAALQDELDRLEGHAEWAVVVRLLEPGEPADPAVDDAQDAVFESDPPTGARYLRGRREALAARERRSERQTVLTTALHDRLADLAVDADLVGRRPLEQTAPAMHGVYLLRWETIQRFETTISEARIAHPEAMIEATGPLPPYHFTTVDLSLEEGDTT